MKTQDPQSMDDATEIMAQRTTSYQDAEKAKIKDLELKGRKQEEAIESPREDERKTQPVGSSKEGRC